MRLFCETACKDSESLDYGVTVIFMGSQSLIKNQNIFTNI